MPDARDHRGYLRVAGFDGDLKQSAGLRVHRGLPELVGVHLAEALEALQPDALLGDAQDRVTQGLERQRVGVTVVERAPIVDLWLRAARRAGAQVEHAGDAIESCPRLAGSRDALGKRLRETERAILIWSADEGRGGADVAALAGKLGFGDKPGSGAFHLPRTPNGRGVADAWAACCDDESESPEAIGLLLVSGDEAAADPDQYQPGLAR